MTVRFFANTKKDYAVETLRHLKLLAADFGLTMTEAEKADVIIAIGGDGTLLKTVHQFPGIPALGLKIGGLGYLSSVEEKDFPVAIEKLAKGRFSVRDRLMLSVNGVNALNDVVISRIGSGHPSQLELTANGQLVTRYMSDGLIFATPTGSTAYSLAAGGPVLMPYTNSIVVTPMNPHALGIRPLVMRDDVVFKVMACARTAGNFVKSAVFADGEQITELEEGGAVTIEKSASTARLIELDGYNPFDILARKLGFSGSNIR